MEYIINEIMIPYYSLLFLQTYKNCRERLTEASFVKLNFRNVYHRHMCTALIPDKIFGPKMRWYDIPLHRQTDRGTLSA